VQELRIAYVGRLGVEPPAGAVEPLPPPADEGLQGARLGILDNNTTGRFLSQGFRLKERVVSSADEATEAIRDVRASGVRLLVADLAAVGLDRVLGLPEVQDMIVFNAGAPDDRFRNGDCRPFLLHTLPSRAMLADALAQYSRSIWLRKAGRSGFS
jgi:ABC transporter substrate binding protein (PQQ-dependent alcohol dehydrogenase system)